ncbi:MAG: amidase [Alphaproteobacteria bacterium]
MADDLWRLSAVALSQGLRKKDYSSVEVMTSVVGRMQDQNPALNAIVYDYSSDALAKAAEADKAIARGDELGALHGLPVTIKVNVDYEGTPNTNGLPALANNLAPGNSPVVQNLLDAGAIIFGKTNTPELSMRGTTDNPLHGLTHSPWDERASPGGSSGGASSACAAGLGAIHHGNDIAGSLRIPASACGLATVKSGLGRVPAFNPSAGAERGLLSQLMSVQGAICREVRDVRLATKVMANRDVRDPWWAPVPFEGPVLPGPIKVAVTKENYGYPIHPEIVAGIDRAADYLRDAGYQVEEVDTPSIKPAVDAWLDAVMLELKEMLGPVAEQHGSKTIQDIFNAYYRFGTMVDHKGYMAAVADRSAMVRSWGTFLEDYPLVLSPFFMRPMYDYDHDETFEGAKDLFDAMMYSYSINYLGFPAGNIPIGLADGRPCGVQIIARRFREDMILDAMQVVEDQVGVLSHQLWDR